MQFATGALDALLSKLSNLLYGEYNLQKDVRKNIQFLIKELETLQAALCSVSEVPLEELPELVKIWARDARELSYDMEDIVDTFLVRVEGPDAPSKRSSRNFFQTVKSLLTLGKRHQIDKQIKNIKERVVELAARRDRYMNHIIYPVTSTLDPRIESLYSKASDLVGTNNARKELVQKLQQQRIVSVVGFGGLGKTTLAKAVYEEIKAQFDCTAFVAVSRNPDMKKFLKDMLHELGQRVYVDDQYRSFDEKQLIDIARELLHDKRYLIIIDDLWNTAHWDMVIKYALPDDNTGCRIIITTRNVTIAKHIGLAYEMQPLSMDNSRVLLCRRIFGTGDQEKCLDEELAEVVERILKKCAGIPLAVITIASLLASKGRNKTKWDDVCKSIGNGMEDSLDVENMRKILSYSYYDLPAYLRTCLLYLSIYPEDFEIDKNRLIWMWRCEGFIQHDKRRRKSLFEVGESYFNELINRSMIQPIYEKDYTKLTGCRVHDMVLDLIRSISCEENFVTVLSCIDETSPSRKVRRLSLQNGKTCHALTQANQNILSVRSIVVFASALDQIATLQSFKVLRVLDLEDYHFSECYNLLGLGSLFHLRYLNLVGTRIRQLPEAIGNMKFLEVLHLSTNIDQLPKCVAQLKNLVCLWVDGGTSIYSGIGSLTSLEMLKWLVIDDDSADTIEGLGLLTELRVLHISLHTDKYNDKLIESLCKLQKIQTIFIDGQLNMNGLDAWVLPQIREWITTGDLGCWFSTLPTWMNNPMQFQDLGCLYIAIMKLRQEDLELLGRLPALRDLQLVVDHAALGIIGRRFVIGPGWFPFLVKCDLRGTLWPLMFHQGAMPRLRELEFSFHMQYAREIAGSDSGLHCGLGNLPSLQDVSIIICVLPGGASEVLEAEATLRHAAEIHPNQPHLDIFTRGIYDDLDDEYVAGLMMQVR